MAEENTEQLLFKPSRYPFRRVLDRTKSGTPQISTTAPGDTSASYSHLGTPTNSYSRWTFGFRLLSMNGIVAVSPASLSVKLSLLLVLSYRAYHRQYYGQRPNELGQRGSIVSEQKRAFKKAMIWFSLQLFIIHVMRMALIIVASETENWKQISSLEPVTITGEPHWELLTE